jgi:hypothetical protein
MKSRAKSLLALLRLAITMGLCVACLPPARDRPAVETSTLAPERAKPTETPSPIPQLDVPTRSRTLTPSAPGKTPGEIKATTMPLSDINSIELARADLARRLDVAESQIVVVHIQADEFPASNLGCPGKENKPMPAFVSGIEIVLAVGERQHVYRARKRTLVYCGPHP